MRIRIITLLCLLGLFVFSAALTAQVPFSFRVQQAQTVQTMPDGGTVTMSSDAVGVRVTAFVTVSYTGTASVTLNSLEQTGSRDFTLSSVPDLTSPLLVSRGQTFSFSVLFTPSTNQRVTGKVAFVYVDGRTTGTLTLNLAGVAPDFVFSYIPQGGNASPVTNGATLSLPQTAVDATSTGTLIVTNRGSGPGLVNAISGGGGSFQLSGVPLPQTTVDAGKELRVTITYSPKQIETGAGTIRVDLFNSSVTFHLQSSSTGPVFAYESVTESSVSAILSGQAIGLPDALVNEKSSISVRFRNTGNADGRILAISVAGAGFTLSDAPFLPLTLTPGASASVTVTFSPTQVGRASGRLRIGDANFELFGNGLGPVIAYAYMVGSSSITVQNNGSVFFSPVAVGRSSKLQFQVTNNGTAPTSFGSVSITGTSTAFTLEDVPAVPITINSGATLTFSIVFTPTTMGSASATLRLDTQSFTVSGVGTTPAPLPSYTISGPAGPQEPLAQLSVGLALSAPYPLALSGVLTLTFNSEVFSNDPSVQFATGGRTINFTIPANTVRAVFANNATQVQLQTGTVAGTILLTPSFTITEGGINMTPAEPTSLSIAVPQSAPRLLSVALSAKTSSSITLLVTGYATGRSITQMDFTFTPTSGENVSTSRVTLNVEPSFLAWYQSSTSQQYGSLFTATVPFTLAGDLVNVTSLADTVQSVSVTIANRLGTSAARSLALR